MRRFVFRAIEGVCAGCLFPFFVPHDALLRFKYLQYEKAGCKSSLLFGKYMFSKIRLT